MRSIPCACSIFCCCLLLLVNSGILCQALKCKTGVAPSSAKWVLEAEDADLLSPGVNVSTDCEVSRGCTGSGFVDYVDTTNEPDGDDDGAYIQWNLPLNEESYEGFYTLKIKYAKSDTENRPLELSVNNQSLGALDFRASGGYWDWQYTQPLSVYLYSQESGITANTIRLSTIEHGSRTDIDHLMIEADTKASPEGLFQLDFSILDENIFNNVAATIHHESTSINGIRIGILQTDTKHGPRDPISQEYVLYKSFDELVNYQQCLSKSDDICYQVTVSGPSDSSVYEISWDGQTFNNLDSSYYTGWGYPVMIHEFGNGCTPDCEDTEALVEYKDYQNVASKTWFRLEDINGATMMQTISYVKHPILNTGRLCLPKENGCYSLHRSGTEDMFDVTGEATIHITSITVDGKVVLDRSNMHTPLSADISTGNNQDSCSRYLSCDSNEVLFEFLFWSTHFIDGAGSREYDVNDKIFTWSLNVQDSTQISGGDLYDGMLYERRGVCVPKTTCLSFRLESKTNRLLWVYDYRYMVLLDGAVYRIDSAFSQDERPIMLGDCRNACDESINEETGLPNEALLDVVAARKDSSYLWVFEENNDDKDTFDVVPGASYDYFFEDWLDTSIVPFSSYDTMRMTTCVQNSICMSHLRIKGIDVGDIQVSKNGIVSNDEYIDDGKSSCDDKLYQCIAFDSGCNGRRNGISGGSITAISSVVLLVSILGVIGAMVMLKRRRYMIDESKTVEQEPNPTGVLS